MVDACRTAQAATTGLQGQAAADAFNNAINAVAGNSQQNQNQQNDNQQNQDQQNNQQQNQNQNQGNNNTNGANLQSFNGQLGGAPPVVVAGGRGFVTNGADFLNIGAAIGRSCDVQHNRCANEANVGGFP